ncbi:class I mannose-6-phosphate isomerase [Clostridium sp. YIM B02515]|uniref:Class I mannose-6-phosphate isomerase n=1 Tax=Clostridium rhizosphaerae TaxID=2803861 RepID=A0ABS1TA36_9CLOT|nr:class I mannose-6-phosphate isomerase [Clostridium rhizosphaerae]MBL4936209.1 class I mannose-6-phosphate isomerase [Clostridium rhizosphaerae]
MTDKYNNYDKYPEVSIKGYDKCAWQGYEDILKELKQSFSTLKKEKVILVLDFYPGVREEEILQAFTKLNPSLVIKSEDYTYNEDTINSMIKDYLTEDRVFGVLTTKKLQDLFIQEKIEEAQSTIDNLNEGIVLVYGVGASLITKGDILLYFDLARWEIQLRFRAGMENWKANNCKDPILSKYKRGYFVEWRLADKHKKNIFSQINYLIDTNQKDNPKMITGDAIRAGLKQVAEKPFRVVPYFDPGVWGGQWMKEVCGLDKDSPNFAWSFDGVPEENSLYLKFGEVKVEVPSINAVFFEPKKLLGERVHSRFGTEFPIRFDFLDTMGGGNLSLQVHPLTEYIQETFGMHYTQDESYYMLDCGEDACVYLGVKEGIDKDEMIKDLKRAEKGEISFPDYKYINKFPAKKHDHFLIPAGTIHCSGKNSMVLEISATPYIFTFKLWDWERVGLDGLPRPIHLKHGEKVIQWDRDTKWVKENLIDQVEVLTEEDGIRVEKTGLHTREFIETIRHWFSKPVLHKTNGSVNVLNLVEGAEAIVESPSGNFEPFIVHYAETFIIPACIEEYTIRPYGKSEGKEIATIKAYVR